LELEEDFLQKDSIKPKRITNVTQNVMAKHHNLLKDALIAIEDFIGVKGTIYKTPNLVEGTLEGRINFLRKLVLSPKAYFTVDRKVGLVPLTVTFKNLSFRLATDDADGENPIEILWDFGDSTISSVSSITPSCVDNVFIEDESAGTITKTYCTPGLFDVTLRVTNKFGTDVITIPSMINARVTAPDEAVVEYLAANNQMVLPGTGVFNNAGEYVPPIIRTPTNSLITMRIPSGPNPHNPGHTYGGEKLTTGNSVIDPITSYTWVLVDDLNHPTVTAGTKASYSVGGVYDMRLRVDTSFGAYRITNYPNSIDVVEKKNIWLFNYKNTTQVVGYEFGLISETYKTMPSSSFTPSIDYSFLNGQPNSTQQIQEFTRNVGFVPRSNIASGDQGESLLFYASGRTESDPIASETVNFVSYNGFLQTFDDAVPVFSRPWNWCNFNSPSTAYFLFGTPTTTAALHTSPTNPIMTQYNIASGVAVESTLNASQFSNGADELLSNVATFTDDGENQWGNFSVYRTAFKNNVGYILRNDNVGQFFRIRSFYRTDGTIGSPVQTIKKLSDMPGPTKLDGELVALTPGLFFFNNTGSISAYNTVGGVWETGGPGVNSVAFRALQDQTVSNFDDIAQPLRAASDGDKRTYLSFDYSVSAFIRFDANSFTFSSLPSRPPGRQWIMGMF
jgi:PKD repeat protein